MLALDVLRAVVYTFSSLYWLLAAGAIVLAVTLGRTAKAKAIWTTMAVVIFGVWPGTIYVEKYRHAHFAREAWAYFKRKCETEAGEKIYKTFTGVKSVLVLKPLPPATEKDLYDQFWYGDPYSNATPLSDRGISVARRLAADWRHRTGTGVQEGLDFVEVSDESRNGYIRIHRPVANDKLHVVEHIDRPTSKFGVLWEDLSTVEDRKYWVAASRLRVVHLEDKRVVAERVGFLIEAGFGSTLGGRRPWLAARGQGHNGRSCPDAHDATDQWFITDVFKQNGGQ